MDSKDQQAIESVKVHSLDSETVLKRCLLCCKSPPWPKGSTSIPIQNNIDPIPSQFVSQSVSVSVNPNDPMQVETGETHEPMIIE